MKDTKGNLVGEWKADWIWYEGAREKPDFFFYARKKFEIHSAVASAKLHISASTDYRLYINGVFVGRGPSPGTPKHQYYDTYNVACFLRRGENVIAAVVHNYAVGLHWQPMSPGGLIIQAEISGEQGTEWIVTDSSWRLNQADSYRRVSPRMMWACQFVETFDFSRYDPAWKELGFDDSTWAAPQIIGKPPQFPWEYLIPREIPFLREQLAFPVSAERGDYVCTGYHSFSFSDIAPADEYAIVYAQAYFYSERDRELLLHLSCDETAKVFLNGELVIRQEYDDAFVRAVTWNGREDYEQFHYGLGSRKEYARVKLNHGWNRVFVAIDKAPDAWGFGIAFVEEQYMNHGGSGFDPVKFENLTFSADPQGARQARQRWFVAGPFESTGLKNSLDHVVTAEFPSTRARVEYDPFHYEGVMDYTSLMRSEEKTNYRSADIKNTITLNEGEFLIVDFGTVQTGFPVLEVEADGEAILDIGSANVMTKYKKMPFMSQLRYVDRIYFTPGVNRYETYSRREGRFFYLSCRKGTNVKLKTIAMNTIGYPVTNKSSFDCSDETLNRIFESSVRTTELLMQDGFEDCLKREGGNHNTRSFIHTSISALNAFGDQTLIRKNILNGIRTQEDNGWFSSHGATDNNADEPTQMLWWVELLRMYDLYTGDTELIGSIYDRLKAVLRYWSRLENKQMLIDSRNESTNARNRICYIDDHSDYGSEYCGLFDGLLLTFNLLYYDALTSAAYLARKLGADRDSDYYTKKAHYVKKAINETFWDEDRQMYSTSVKESGKSEHVSLAVLIAMLFYEVCDDEKEEKVLTYLVDTLGAAEGKYENYHLTMGFYYMFFDVLFRYGKEEIAYGFWRTYFGKWLALGQTTFTEHFNLKDYLDKDTLDYEYNTHMYGTSMHVLYYSHILGVLPQETGFRKVVIQPYTGDLDWAKGHFYTPQGEVRVSWQTENGNFSMDVELPEGCEYELKRPGKFKDCTVKVNGKAV